MKLHRIT